MADRKADFMLWMGDNVYLRQQEWNTRTGLVYRYNHDRAIPELQRFLSSTHHYAIWDDHDYGPNDSDRGFWNKTMALDVFEMFWANPSYGVGTIEGAITSFQWGDADFFLLDNRTYRSPNWLDGEDKTQLGEEQLQWLLDNLVKSYATFKFVVMGGQFLSNSGVYEAYTNYGFANERQKIIDFIHEENIRNVVFLSGDVHFSEVSVLREEGKPTIWDLTSSPMNSGVNTNASSQNNTLRIPESVIMERNFAEVTLSGPKDQRSLTIVYYDTDGEKIWEYTFDTENR
jgi:alkaline phosphatase D